MSSEKDAQGVCPVDHSTREAWLKHSTKEYHEATEAPAASPVPAPVEEKCPVDHNSREVLLQQAKMLPTSNGGESFETPAESCRRQTWYNEHATHYPAVFQQDLPVNRARS